MKLVEDWKGAWRWFSVQAMVLASGLQGAWLAMPPDLKAQIPGDAVSVISMVLLAAGIIGRLVPQGETK